MKRLLSLVWSGVALGWLAGAASAQQSGMLPPSELQQAQFLSGGTVVDPPMMMPMDGMGGDVGSFSAGVGLYLLQPNWESNPAYNVANSAVDPTGIATVDFRYNVQASPLIWCGFVCANGFGTRTRWWQYDQSSTETFVAPAGTDFSTAGPLGLFLTGSDGDTLSATGDLALKVWDFELIQNLALGDWNCLFGGGVRYAHWSQNYIAALTDAAGGSQFLASGHNFNGAGPTACVEINRLIGMTGISLYGIGRGALLFGSAKERAFTSGSPALEVPALAAARSQADVLPVVEFELGGEYGIDVGAARFFVLCGLVGQAWLGAGNHANTESATLFLVPTANNNQNLGFVGLAVRAGLNF